MTKNPEHILFPKTHHSCVKKFKIIFKIAIFSSNPLWQQNCLVGLGVYHEWPKNMLQDTINP